MTNSDFVFSDDLNKASGEGNSDQLKEILERVKAERRSCEPLLNLQYRVRCIILSILSVGEALLL